MLPQFFPAAKHRSASLAGVQPQMLATPGLPPPQVWLAPLQAPHETLRCRPHRSIAPIEPQFFPAAAQSAASVSPAQPQAFAVPPPPQA